MEKEGLLQLQKSPQTRNEYIEGIEFDPPTGHTSNTGEISSFQQSLRFFANIVFGIFACVFMSDINVLILFAMAWQLAIDNISF